MSADPFPEPQRYGLCIGRPLEHRDRYLELHVANVNAIAPGYIATDNTLALQDDAERSRSIPDRIPAGRWGRATDLAGAAVFLASDAASYVHGVVLPVYGGWLGR